MKVVVYGKNKAAGEQLVTEAGFEVVDNKPQYVVSYGGDGTLIAAEALYPGIPKIILRDSPICKKCSALSNTEVLRRVRENRFSTEILNKLQVAVDHRKLVGMNDIIIHNNDPRHAIRYTLAVNDRPVGNTIIGDGIVVATPFGSTAYYRSITDSFFEVGIGLAFNNSTEQSDHMVLGDGSIIKIKISRGPAVVYADNHKEDILLEAGMEAIIQKSVEKVSIVVPN